MSYRVKVLRDNPIGFWPLDEISGTTASDISGCGNDGTYSAITFLNTPPLITGGVYATRITSTSNISLPATKNYYGNSVSGGGFANTKSSDNDFSLEIWFKPSITTVNRTPIFADQVNQIGIYYENNNILFKLNSEELYYNINSQNKVFHIVAIYDVNSIKIYVDGVVAASKNIPYFKFSNATTGNFQIGPTANASDIFLVDAPAIYRYALKENKISSHYSSGIYHVNALQIVNQDNGIFFSTNEENMGLSYVYEYDIEKMQEGITEESYFEKKGKYVSFYKSTGAKSLILFDAFMIPSTTSIVSSKIEWKSHGNIIVQMGTDGITYPHTLTNGSFLPLYNKEQSLGNKIIYLKITFSTSDSSKYFPKFTNLKIKFYRTKDIYSDNKNYFITSDKEYDIASFNYPGLLRMDNDGIQTSTSGGFKINCDKNINTVEFFYVPSALTASTLINTSSSNFSWDGAGAVSKTNINSIYVNGVDRSAQTTASSIFTVGQLHHVVVKFTTAVTGDIKFNYNITGGPSNKFNNIALYESALNATQILRHYSEYTQRPTSTVTESDITVTDSGINYANNEWAVISTI